MDSSKVEATPQGGIRVSAYLTREGIFDYRRPDGSIRRELRPADEVFRKDSMATLEGAPVTQLHPTQGYVDPSSFRKDTVGHIHDNVRPDGGYVAASVTVNDKTALDAVKSGLRELSCGYRCDFDPAPGNYRGSPYDGVQRNIRYNHVAIVPKGRAGADVGLRFDAADAIQVPDNTPAPATLPKVLKMKIRIDGIDYEAGSAEHLQAQAKLDAAKDAQIATLTATSVAEKSRADKAEGERDAEKTARADSEDPKKFQSKVLARVALEASVKDRLPAETKLDSLSDREIKIAVIRAKDGAFDPKDRTDDYINGRFDNYMGESATGVTIATANAAAVGLPKGAPASQNIARVMQPWEMPLAHTKQVVVVQ